VIDARIYRKFSKIGQVEATVEGTVKESEGTLTSFLTDGTAGRAESLVLQRRRGLV
jgi:hypothetical protein